MVEKPGEYTIPALTVTIGGIEYKTAPVKFTASTLPTTDLMGLEASVSSTECYIGQPIALSVKWHLAANQNSFSFNIPDIMNQELFKSGNLQPDSNSRIERVSNTAIGDLVISQSSGTYKGRSSLLVSFNKYIIPQQAGEITIDPISVVSRLETGRQSDGFFYTPTYSRFIAQADPITLNVKPLPTENRPADYYGLVGRNFILVTELVNAPRR